MLNRKSRYWPSAASLEEDPAEQHVLWSLHGQFEQVMEAPFAQTTDNSFCKPEHVSERTRPLDDCSRAAHCGSKATLGGCAPIRLRLGCIASHRFATFCTPTSLDCSEMAYFLRRGGTLNL